MDGSGRDHSIGKFLFVTPGSIGTQSPSIADRSISNHDTYAREQRHPETLGELTQLRKRRQEFRTTEGPRAHQNMKRRNTARMNTTPRQLIWNSPRAHHPFSGRSPAPVSHEQERCQPIVVLMTCRKGQIIQDSGNPPPSQVCLCLCEDGSAAPARVDKTTTTQTQPQRHCLFTWGL